MVVAFSLPWSDGVPGSAPPTKLEKPPTTPGASYNYNRLITRDDSKLLNWLSTIGGHLQVAMDQYKDLPNGSVVLADLPANYTLVEHCKSAEGTSQARKDAYLYGHPSGGKFRSINEFLPHAIWLATSTTRDREECGCRFCGNAPSRRPANSRTPGGTPGSARRVKKTQSLSGQSLVALNRVETAKQQMRQDLAPLRHVFRQGEIVLMDGFMHLVLDCLTSPTSEPPVTLAEALATHRYRLLKLMPDAKPMPCEARHSSIRPYLSQHHRNVTTHSAIGLQTIKKTGEVDPGGPAFLGWYLGPEKIWQNDIVRLAYDTTEAFVHISLIFLDLDDNEVKIRGDHIELYSSSAGSNGLVSSLPNPNDNRSVPDMLKVYAATKGKLAKYTNPEGYDIEAPLAEVLGRMYWPSAFNGRLYPVGELTMVRGRAESIRQLVEWDDDRVVQLGIDAAEELSNGLAGGVPQLPVNGQDHHMTG